ncbi:MAG TPA: pyridoxal-dependent decarboxylase, partial [Cytophagales bacterium]|nr:pyridoxal-dependent decarboxylase [Cytophagales bacterium]
MDFKQRYILGIRDYYDVSQAYKYIFSDLPENKAYYQKSIHQTVNVVLKHLESRTTPYSGASIQEVKDRFDIRNINLDEGGFSLTETLAELKTLYLDDAISFHSPKYVAHLNCPILVPALAAEVLISAINSSMDTWDQSAGGTFIELKLIAWTLSLMGYPAGGDGIFTSGGTQSNLMGLLLARDHYIKTHYGADAKLEGLPAVASKFKILCSEVSHFSVKKSASLLGLGQHAVVTVPVDRRYSMDTKALEEAIAAQKEQGNIPIAIVGTAGTTDFGSIDPLERISTIAKAHALWFHVD